MITNCKWKQPNTKVKELATAKKNPQSCIPVVKEPDTKIK